MFTGRLRNFAHLTDNGESVEKCNFETLIANSAVFEKKIMKFPTKLNRIAVIAGKDMERRHIILSHAKGSRIIGMSAIYPLSLTCSASQSVSAAAGFSGSEIEGVGCAWPMTYSPVRLAKGTKVIQTAYSGDISPAPDFEAAFIISGAKRYNSQDRWRTTVGD